MFNKEDISDQIEIIKHMKISYAIGVHVEKGVYASYCLVRHIDKTPENILLAKQSKTCLREEVENLAKYFKAKILIEK